LTPSEPEDIEEALVEAWGDDPRHWRLEWQCYKEVPPPAKPADPNIVIFDP
jgi:hypothetical protein